MESDVRNRSVVVTGGTIGIGKEISETFVNNGAKVEILDIGISPEVTRYMDQIASRSEFLAKGDVTKEDPINGVIDDIL